MIVLEHQYARTARDREQLCRGSDAIADGGNQRDVAGIRIDQPRRSGTGALMYLARKFSGNEPRLALAPDRGVGRVLRPPRQRAVGGGVEVADVARDIELFALGGKHGLNHLDAEASQQPTQPSAVGTAIAACRPPCRKRLRRWPHRHLDVLQNRTLRKQPAP